MLAQNFKTAANLGISEAHKRALCKTLVLLETDRMTHVDERSIRFDVKTHKAKFTGHFNMARWAGEHPCGTACCIGGTAEVLEGVYFDRGETMPVRLRELFYPKKMTPSEWGSITPSQAATALRSYLTTGDARWDLAIAP